MKHEMKSTTIDSFYNIYFIFEDQCSNPSLGAELQQFLLEEKYSNINLQRD